MARTNQGIFKELKNKYKALENEYEKVMEDYFSGGNWNGYGDFIADFSYSADNVYYKANDLAFEIRGMLKATKFEDKDKKEKYEEMLSESLEIARGIKNVFDRTLELIKMSGDGFTDAEQRTLDALRIYR